MPNEERHVRAYERMLERIRGGDGRTGLQQRLQQAREAAVHLGELTRGEAELIGQYVRRDLRQVGDFLDRGGHALAEWLNVDLDALESDTWQWLRRLADPTELAWLRFSAGDVPEGESRLTETPPGVETSETFRTGEICGLGTLVCRNCEQLVHFTRPVPIPPCPRCHKTLFSRQPN